MQLGRQDSLLHLLSNRTQTGARHLFHRLPEGPRDLVRTALYGIAGGLAAVAFQTTINFFINSVWGRLKDMEPLHFAWISLLLILSTSLVAGWLMSKLCPEAAGSGIPQIKLSFWRDFGFMRLRVALVKFIAGALTIGGGSSLGREGPSVQIAGVLASNVAGMTGVPRHQRRDAMSAGAAAGLAAAFNTPISAITFVLEEILEDLNNARHLTHALFAAVIATLITHMFVGRNPAFDIPSIGDFSATVYPLALIVAALSALTGVGFQYMTLRWRSRIRTMHNLPSWAKPAVGAFLTWLCGVMVFCTIGHIGVFGLGYSDLQQMLGGNMLWYAALLLLAAKFFATVSAYAWGGCGGIFAPNLFLGASVGACISDIADIWLPMTPSDHTVLTVVGMSACLGAVVRAPITSILIVFEMTQEFRFVPVLLLGGMVSQTVSRLILKENFYTEILRRDGANLEKVMPLRDLSVWENREVLTLATASPVVVHDLDAEELRKFLEKHSHHKFPVVTSGKCQGILDRAQALKALDLKQMPELHPPSWIQPHEPLSRARKKLLDSSTDLLVVAHSPDSPILGIVTIHDFLRAETKAMEGPMGQGSSG